MSFQKEEFLEMNRLDSYYFGGELVGLYKWEGIVNQEIPHSPKKRGRPLRCYQDDNHPPALNGI